MKKRLLTLFCLFLVVIGHIYAQSYNKVYEDANDLYQNSKYEQAKSTLDTIIKTVARKVENDECVFDNLVLYSNILVLYGEICEKLDLLEEAINYSSLNYNLQKDRKEEFKKLRMTETLFLYNYETIGLLYEQNNQTDEALKVFADIAECYKRKDKSRWPFELTNVGRCLVNRKLSLTNDTLRSLILGLDELETQKKDKENVSEYKYILMDYCMNRTFNKDYNTAISTLEKRINYFKSEDVDKLEARDIAIFYSYILGENVNFLLSITDSFKINKVIYLNNKRLDILRPYKNDTDELKMKFAEIYADLALLYFNASKYGESMLYCDSVDMQINAIHMKEYREKDKNYDMSYLFVLQTLSYLYSQFGRHQLAAFCKDMEIAIKETYEIEISPLEYSSYMDIIPDKTEHIINLCKSIIDKSSIEEKENPDLYFIWLHLGKALSLKYYILKKSSLNDKIYLKNIQDSCDYAFSKAKDVYYSNESYFINKYSIYPLYKYYLALGQHHAKLKDLNKAKEFLAKAVELYDSTDGNIEINPALASLVFVAGASNDKLLLHKYLPEYFKLLQYEMSERIKPLTSSERTAFVAGKLGQGLWQIPELGKWFPNDSLCSSYSYNCVLLEKYALLDMEKEDRRYAINDSIVQLQSMIIKGQDERLNYRNSILLKDKRRRIKIENKEKITQSKLNNWKDVQAKLADNDVAIEFVTYPVNTWYWCEDSISIRYSAIVIRKTDKYPQFVDLCDESEILNIFNLQPKSYNHETAMSPYNIIWEKLEPYINTHGHIFFSPQGLLALINIEAFIDNNGIPIGEKYNMYRLSTTRKIGEYSDKLQIDNIAIFGGIKYSCEDINNVDNVLNVLNTRGNLSFLKNTEKEADEINREISKSNKKAFVFKGTNGTENEFKKLSGKPINVIHMATHGFYVPQSKQNSIPFYKNNKSFFKEEPLFYSGLLMANSCETWNKEGNSNIADDGILLSFEIAQQNLENVDMVVLSACETGLGWYSIDSMHGLQSAFKIAGVQTIVMSLWKIDDYATALMMTTFYKELLKTRSKHEAFKEAQRVLREKYEDPYYWASFIMLD